MTNKNSDKKGLIRLRELSVKHKGLMDSGIVELAGCFDCEATFPPGEIKEYIEEYALDGKVVEHAGRCPRCGTDSVIPVKLAENALRTLNEEYMKSASSDLPAEADDGAYLDALLLGEEEGKPVIRPRNRNIH